MIEGGQSLIMHDHTVFYTWHCFEIELLSNYIFISMYCLVTFQDSCVVLCDMSDIINPCIDKDAFISQNCQLLLGKFAINMSQGLYWFIQIFNSC